MGRGIYIIKIAICDDEKIILDYTYFKIKKTIEELYGDKEKEISKFINGKLLLNEIDNIDKGYDLVVLDIDMPEIDGFEVAESIRKYNKDIIILFLTSKDEFVYESFKYSPFRFLRKSKLDEELEEALNNVIKIIEKRKGEKQYVFDTDKGEMKFDINDILYIECFNKKAYIKTFDMKYKLLKVKFNELLEEVSKFNFISTYRNCAVNIKYIYSIGKMDITLDNNERLAVSRYKINDLKKAFISYAQ